MTPNRHNPQLRRLLTLATRLLQGARLTPRATAQELGVHERTISRDLDLLSGYLPIASDNGRWKKVEV